MATGGARGVRSGQGAACGRQGGGRGRDPRLRHPVRHPHRRPSGEDYARAGTPVCRRHRRTRACRKQGPEAEPADGRQPAQDHRRGNGRGLRRLRRRHRRPRRSGAPHDIVFEVVERRAEIKECPKCKGRFPDNIPCSTASAFRPSSSTCWLPKCCPCAVAFVQAISGIKLSEASAMLSRCVMGGGRRGAPPATPDVDDFGSTVSGSMSWDPDVQVPAPQARPGGKRSARATRASWASYMGQCSHQLCGSHLLRELTFVVEATARLMKSLLREVCHKVNKSASKTLNDAGRKRYRTIRAPGNCPISRRKENVDASPTRTTCTNVS